MGREGVGEGGRGSEGESVGSGESGGGGSGENGGEWWGVGEGEVGGSGSSSSRAWCGVVWCSYELVSEVMHF